MAVKKKDELENIQVQMRNLSEAEQAQYSESKPDPASVTTEFLVSCAEDGERGAAEIFRRLFMTWDNSPNSDVYKNQQLFCSDPDLGWHYWDGHHWNPDKSMRFLEALDGVVKVLRDESSRQWSLFRQAKKLADEDAQELAEHRARTLWKLAKTLCRTQVRRSTLLQAAAGRDAPPWDRQPWMLPVKNGVIDLKTGALRSGHPSDFLRSGAPVAYREDAACPTFEAFVLDIMDGNIEMAEYIQRVLGYALTGLVTHHKVWILCGRGRNGKGTLIETMKDLLGPLATPIQTEMLLEQKFSRSSAAASPDLVDLMGKRLVWASETGENKRFSTEVIKKLTGADTLKGRPLQGDMLEIRPTHKLFVLANERPAAPSSDQAFWDRAIVIEFPLRYVEDRPGQPHERLMDVDLPDKLRAELEGILRYCVIGCLKWQRDGLRPPGNVIRAVRDYRTEMDVLGRFLSDDCVRIPGAKIQCGELYGQYEKWAKDNGIKPWSSIKLSREMRARGIKQEVSRVYYWMDIEVRNDFNAHQHIGWDEF